MAFSLIASASAASPDGNGVTTGAVDTTGADLLIINVGYYFPLGPVTVSDSKGNSWSALTAYGFSGGATNLFWSKPTSVGAGHTFSSNVSTTFPSIEVMAFSGSHATPLDQATGAFDSVHTLQPGTITPTQDNELVITGLGHENNSAGAVSVDGGFTGLIKQAYGSGTNEGSGMAYLIQTTAAAANPTWNYTADATAGAAIVSFKASGVTAKRFLLIPS